MLTPLLALSFVSLDDSAYNALARDNQCTALLTFERGFHALAPDALAALTALATVQPHLVVARVDCDQSLPAPNRMLCTPNRTILNSSATYVGQPLAVELMAPGGASFASFSAHAGTNLADFVRSRRAWLPSFADASDANAHLQRCLRVVRDNFDVASHFLNRVSRDDRIKAATSALLHPASRPRISTRAVGGGDWIFVAHHKSGTTVGESLARAMCSHFGRPLRKYTFREQPAETTHAGGAACHFLVKVYAEDIRSWLERLHADPSSRLVHFVRHPADMVLSGYRFHRRGSELGWTNSTECSRDLCRLPEAWGANASKLEAALLFRTMPASPWLREYGCAAEYSTYLDCLRSLSPAAGLRVEARRAYSTIHTMVELDELTSSDNQARSLDLKLLARPHFNSTARTLVQWLTSGHPGGAVEAILGACIRAVFQSRRVTAIRTRASRERGPWGPTGPFAREVLFPELRELADRASWITKPHKLGLRRLFSKRYRKLPYEFNSRGIVHCSAPKLLDASLRMLSQLVKVTNGGPGVPVQVWHISELSANDQQHIIQHPALNSFGSGVRDLSDVLHKSVPGDERVHLRGFMCKPLALLAAPFEEVMLIDHDIKFLSHPMTLFDSSPYTRSGMLIFRDRSKLFIRGQPLKDSSRFLRLLVRRRLLSREFLADDHDYDWQPSTELLDSPMLSGESSHATDSSLLLISKRRAPRAIAALYALHERHRYELYGHLHGDKETYWLACELGGEPECGISPLAAGEMGTVTTGGDASCVVGNLMQFHPDDPRTIVACNCKPHASWMYTHVSKPRNFRNLSALTRPLLPYANLAGASTTLALRDSTLELKFRNLSLPLHLLQMKMVARRRSCLVDDAETIEAAMAKTHGIMASAKLCTDFGVRCRKPATNRSATVP